MKSGLDAEILDAVGRSSLRGLPGEVIAHLARGARIRDIAAGVTARLEDDSPFAQLVLSGLIRAYVSASSGRTMTIRYCRPGALVGIGTIFNESSPHGRGNLSALVDSRVLMFDAATFRQFANRDIRVARALLSETSARVGDYINELESSAFASLRQRLARHLLDLAAEQQTEHRLIARASQQDFAQAVGTVREIVVRILHEMRDEGLVRTARGRVELLAPERLEAETFGHRE